MTQLFLNNLDPQILDNLRIRAAKHNRSLEDESKAILQEALATEITTKTEKTADSREQATQIRRSLHGRTHTDSALLIREDRDQ